MKRMVLSVIVLGLMLFSGCSGGPQEAAGPAGETTPPPSDSPVGAPSGSDLPGAEITELTCRIVDGAQTGQLLLAGEQASDVYTVGVQDLPVWLDGAQTDYTALRNGMTVTLAFSGAIAETYPAQPGVGCYLTVVEEQAGQCALWLQVLEDLWTVDDGLNGGITQVGVDLSQVPGLTEGERSAIAWAFAQAHGVDPVTGTLEQLWEQGYFTPMTDPAEGYENSLALYQWEDGVHFSIDVDEDAVWNLPDLGPGEQPPQLVAFDAQKWRSGLGAYSFSGCVGQQWGDDPWTFTIGSEAIA